MSGGNDRGIGYGLIAGGGIIALLLLLWLLVSGVNAGGFVLGLLLIAVLALPLAGAGWFMLRRAAHEQEAEGEFVRRRRVLESDRIFRRELAAELRQLARRPDFPGKRLGELAEDLERRAYDSPEWYDAVQLDDADASTLRRYDNLVWERAKRLAASGTAVAEDELRRLEDALDQRRDLLLRGRRAPVLTPSQLTRAGEPRRGEAALLNLGVSDAVSTEDGQDYVVESVASYFDAGQVWKLARLEPSRVGSGPLWLYVGPSGLDVALMQEHAGAGPDESRLLLDGSSLPVSRRGTATVDLEGRRGSAEGVLVSYALYQSGQEMGFAESWPDGATHAYTGRAVRPDDLQVWPHTVA